MDRTQWQWGKRPINILMLSLVHKGTAIPIYWSMISHRGNSNTQQRIGEWRHDKEPIKMKKHGRLAKSLFRYGLDFIRELLFLGQFSIIQFRICLKKLHLERKRLGPVLIS